MRLYFVIQKRHFLSVWLSFIQMGFLSLECFVSEGLNRQSSQNF